MLYHTESNNYINVRLWNNSALKPRQNIRQILVTYTCIDVGNYIKLHVQNLLILE